MFINFLPTFLNIEKVRVILPGDKKTKDFFETLKKNRKQGVFFDGTKTIR